MSSLSVILITITLFISQMPNCNGRSQCRNQIFCTGDLLKAVQLAGLFKDSKTFVDMSLVGSIESTLKHFEKLKVETHGQPLKDDLLKFLAKNFQANNEELEVWAPTDFKTNPKFLKKISNIQMRTFAKSLVNAWLSLGRKIKATVFNHSFKYSIIPVPNGFIVPGGRFREYYYWDSYWIIKGLLVCEMIHTTKGMIDNFFSIVDTFGFIPNGGRIYYLDRSQPPVLTLMAKSYIDATNDLRWLKPNIKYLEMELEFWLTKKTVDVFKDGEMHVLAHYQSFSDEPRPESYMEDLHTAGIFSNKEDQKQCYRNIRSGAESGWDFSGRWFFDHKGGNRANMSYIETSRIIPVDLNAFLCQSFKLLHRFFKQLSNRSKEKYWLKKAESWEKSMKSVLYDESEGVWFDYDLKLNKLRKFFYPSNLAPLYCNCFDPKESKKYGKAAVDYLKKVGIMDFPGGIPTSLNESGQQWDYPNAWAPLQSMVIFGLENTGEETAKNLAREFAKRWLWSNLREFEDTTEMFEKYNALYPGLYGHGGEYEVQTGFGWTNGVILELIDHYYVKHKLLQ